MQNIFSNLKINTECIIIIPGNKSVSSSKVFFGDVTVVKEAITREEGGSI